MEKGKHISIYCKGYRQSVSYYRNYQYFDNIPEIIPEYRVMMSKRVEKKYMPISKQPVYIKAFAYFHSLVRVSKQLFRDYIKPPDALVVHRRFISKYMPAPLQWILKGIQKKGVPIYWDIDDNIKGLELRAKEYELLSRISTGITVTHEYLKNTIDPKYHNKVSILHTTDGDLYKQFVPEVNNARLVSLGKEIKMVWVATNVNLPYLQSVGNELDDAAKILKERTGKQLTLTVVCNGKLVYPFKHLNLINEEWTREGAIQRMKEAHIGIMPLIDNDFTRGKGGFKLVQYQSIGLPTIASNVGFNKTVVAPETGFLVEPNSEDGWAKSVLKLSDPQTWEKYSQCAFKNWCDNFSFEKNLDFWKKQLIHHH